MALYNKSIKNIVIDYWYNNKFLLFRWLLYPLEIMYLLTIWLRNNLYNYNILKVHKFTVPIIVVGNITVGGTGKTPMVMYLANYLRSLGWQPGIITRGYKSNCAGSIVSVAKDADPNVFGDEAVVIANNTDCPVIIGKNRPKAAKFLLNNHNIDIIIADDGLQHYALSRDLEIVMVDGQRIFGNGYMLPRGPLREHINRLRRADLILVNGSNNNTPCKLQKLDITDKQQHTVNLVPQQIYNILDDKRIKQYTDFKVAHAVAAIGNNDRFFKSLEGLGIKIIKHAFPDHYQYQAKDFYFHDNLPVIMTEKDAIKCKTFAKDNFWYLKVAVVFDEPERFAEHLRNFL
jgi:tetraacyldisaccharide 4'-kinase